MSPPAIEARSVHVAFGDGPGICLALADVSLDVVQGEVLLIVGPSGSGKTTLTQTLGCLLTPSDGTVRVFGRRVDEMNARELDEYRRQHYGFVFQAYNLFPALNAWENVAVALDLNGVRGAEAETRARALLDEVGLASKADCRPAILSGGQRQRVAIARALAADPEILLADEPTAALDTASGQSVVSLFGRLARSRGRAVVIVTHDPRIQAQADRIVTLEDGRIVDVTTRH